jgi:hypothetical protein
MSNLLSFDDMVIFFLALIAVSVQWAASRIISAIRETAERFPQCRSEEEMALDYELQVQREISDGIASAREKREQKKKSGSPEVKKAAL